MKKLFKFSAMLVACSTLGVQSAMADEKAEKVLQKARIAATLGNQDLHGHLRKNGKKYPIALFLKGKNIQFAFQEKKGGKWVRFHMRLKEGGAQLFEMKNGKTKVFDRKKLGQKILNTDLTYQDLSMTFLYWKKATVVKEESIKMQKCDVVRLVNSNKNGNYDVVYAWVHKKYGALMQLVGYNSKGMPKKKFAVEKLMRVKGEYTLQRMRVDSYDTETKKNTGTTYLEFTKKKPKRLR